MSESQQSYTKQQDGPPVPSTNTNDPSDTGVNPPSRPTAVYNIVTFGATGVGKSSLVEMLCRLPPPQTIVSGDARGYTEMPERYQITTRNADLTYQIWDTPGLNEGREGSVETVQALQKIHRLVRNLSDNNQCVNLLFYCISAGRYKDFLRVNYDLVAKIICEDRVPVVAVINGLENEKNMDEWWNRNHGQFERYMKFANHVCVTTTRGKRVGSHFVFEKEFNKSRDKVQAVIRTIPLGERWTPANSDTFEAQRAEYMRNHNSRTETEQRLVFRFVNSLRNLWR